MPDPKWDDRGGRIENGDRPASAESNRMQTPRSALDLAP